MKLYCTLTLLCIALLQCSCSAVLTKEHIADRTEDLLQEKLEGTWQHEEGVFQIEFDDEGTGWGAGIEWEEGAFKLSQGRLQAKKFGDAYLMTLEPIIEDPDDRPDGHLLIRFSFLESGEVHFYPPDVSAFEALVQKKELKGQIEKGKYSTQVLLDEIRKVIPKIGDLEKMFPDSDDKVRLRRLPAFDSP